MEREKRTDAKVTSEHLQRKAYVYVRQSSPRQVEIYQESRRRQYQMVEWAQRVGWEEREIIVVDDDQGKTASVAGSRKGFGEMIRAVGRGSVGIVISLELSRLGRNSPDWANLIYLCRFTQTLISDGETIYDPSLSADRMVLGIRGQVCELELDTSIARMVDARWSQAQRGEARFVPPAGYDFNELGELVMTADEAVAEAIRTVFKKFEQLGNASLVCQYFKDAGREFPVRRMQPRRQPVVWMKAQYPPILRMLKHPIYAGAYVYGRTEVVKEVDGECGIKLRRQLRKDWPVLLKDHHPAYITYETYVRNQRRLEGNVTKRRTGGESGPVREGGALLQGRVRCGQCGRSMSVSYGGRDRRNYHYYFCLGGPFRIGENSCQTISGKRLDDGVVEKFLEVTAPAGVEAAALAEQELREESERVERYWTLQQERATYEAQRAERQYMEVEPENRVVARELERRWNAKLVELSRVREQAHAAMARQQPLTDEEVARARRLGQDVAAVWDAPTTTNQDRKRLLRTLIEEVQVRSDEQRHYGRIVWIGGAVTDIVVQRVRRGQTHVAGPELVEQLRKLAEEFNDAQISRILTRQGVRNKDGKPYTRSGVCALRRRHEIPSCPRPIARDDSEGPFTAQEAARELGVANSTIHAWIREGVLRAGQAAPGAPWRIVLTEEVRKRLALGEAPDGWLVLSEAARRIGVPKSTVAHWIKTGKLKAVRTMVGRRSRWKVDISSVDNAVQTAMFERTSNN